MTTPPSAAPAPVSTAGRLGPALALAAILALAAGLRFSNLDAVGYGNQYYAAAVASMSQSWHNFFYVAFDPGGFVSVDKPPLGLWVQVLSVQLFGFSGWSLLLPQALAGVLAVGVLYALVRRAFGVGAGLLAALLLALTPISVAADRNNTMDAQLVLTSLLAGWAALRAVERGQLRWLLLSAAWIGVGFNIKMLQALLIAPAVFGLYLLAAPVGWLKKLAQLAAAGLLLAALSLAWPLAVDLTPADQRPYVGSSQNNSVMELIVGHNGAARLGPLAGLLGISAGRGPAAAPANANGNPPAGRPPLNPPGQLPPGQRPPTQPGPAPNPAGPAAQRPGGDETGLASPFRLFNAQLAGQASWFLPLALISLLALSAAAGWAWNQRQINLWFWGLWLIPQVVFFSFAGLFHRYYLGMLSPAIAALAAAGLAAAWPRRGLFAAALAGAALAVSGVVWVSDTAGWAAWLIPLTLALAGLGALSAWGLAGRARAGAAALALAGLLAAPAAYALTPVLSGGDVGLPFASPSLLAGAGARRGGGVGGSSRLAEYLLGQRAGEAYLAATLNANTAAPLILATGEPVMALGGFSGNDPILTTADLAARLAAGQVRFLLLPVGERLPGVGAGPAPGQSQNTLAQWVAGRCQAVPAALWQTPGQAVGGGPGPGGVQQLYDCAALQP